MTSLTFMFGLRAAAGLPDAKGEVAVEFSGDDFIGGLRD